LLAGTTAGALAHVCFGRAGRASAWLRAAVVALVLCAAAGAAVSVGVRSVAALWSPWSVLVAWGLVGVTALGAAPGPGGTRLRWIGAALFGAGFLVLDSSSDPVDPTWQHATIDSSLRWLCPGFDPPDQRVPAKSRAMAAANRRIRAALQERVPMHFPQETALSDVLAYVSSATSFPDGRLPIEVDPVGLQEAEKTMQSTVTIELEGVPLKTSLMLVLRQLGLCYWIEEGVLAIDSQVSERNAREDDPRLAAGHCLLALLATGAGALTAPIVVGARGS
jgi:hypothetical protein